MPLDAMLLSAAVVAVFVGFAAVLYWADKQTNSSDFRPDGSDQKRRSF